MKSLVFRKYGDRDKIELIEQGKPSLRAGRAIVRMGCMGLNPRDLAIQSGELRFLTGWWSFPRLMGCDFSGEIVEIGENSAGLKVGDEVFGYYESIWNGISAEYVSIPIKYLARKPSTISHEQAAALPCAFLTAQQALRDKCQPKKGESVLIYGASGGVGTAAIQLAKRMGVKVIAVSSSRNEAYCKRFGVDEFIGYDKEDIFKSTTKYDHFFQVFSKQGVMYRKAKKLVKKGGRFVTLLPNPLLVFLSLFSSVKLRFVMVKNIRKDLEEMAQWVSEGGLKINIEKVLSLNDCQEAYESLASNHTQGKLIIKF